MAGTQFLSHDAEPVPNTLLTTDGKPGVEATYTKLDMTNINHPEQMKVLAKRVEATMNPGAQPLPSEAAGIQPLAIRWTGDADHQRDGRLQPGAEVDGYFRMQLDGKNVTSSYGGDPNEAKLGRVHLEAGKPAALTVEYSSLAGGAPQRAVSVVEGGPGAAAGSRRGGKESRCRDRGRGHY